MLGNSKIEMTATTPAMLKHFLKVQDKLSRSKNTCIASLNNISWVCLGINVFKINIEREGEKKFVSVSQQLWPGM